MSNAKVEAEVEAESNTQPQEPYLSNEEIERYARQLVLPEFGRSAQTALKNSSALIIGVGGLGTPAALYLVGAGIGTLGLIDNTSDKIDLSNLHRQILYTTPSTNEPKLKTAVNLLKQHNPNVNIQTPQQDDNGDSTSTLTSKNAISWISQYDVVLDCTDNVMSRYIIGDACARTKTPLISGAAIGFNGQLMTLSLSESSPCYRCILPKPPPPNCTTSCADGGVLGPAPGTIGTLQALEAIKILSRFQSAKPLNQTLLLFDAATTSFRSFKLRPKSAQCIACTLPPRMNVETYDYAAFTTGGASCAPPTTSLRPDQRITIQQFASVRQSQPASTYTVIDVRPTTEYDICHLPESQSKPLTTSLSKPDEVSNLVNTLNQTVKDSPHQTILICRRGIASQTALQKLTQAGAKNVVDVIGGLQAWHDQIDKTFPMY